MMRRLAFIAFALSVLYVTSANAQAVSSPKILQFGIGRPSGSNPDPVCVYDRAGVCQTIGTLPQSGGPFTTAVGTSPGMTGDTTVSPGTNVSTTNTVKGKTVLPTDGSVVMNVSGMTVLTPGQSSSPSTAGGSGQPLSLSSLLNSISALASINDSASATYPTPQLQVAPVASETITDVALWDHIVDKAGESNRVFAHSLTYEASTGGPSGTPCNGQLACERVNLYLGGRAKAGSGLFEVLNTQVQVMPGMNSPATGYEDDVTNSDIETGAGFGAPNRAVQNIFGMGVNTLSSYRMSGAYYIDGKLNDGPNGSPGSAAWHRGYFAFDGSISPVDGCTFCDYSNSYAPLQVYGSHNYGIDLTNGTYSAGGIAFQGKTSNSAQNSLTWVNSNGTVLSQFFDDGTGNLVLSGVGAKTPALLSTVAAFAATTNVASSNVAVLANGTVNLPVGRGELTVTEGALGLFCKWAYANTAVIVVVNSGSCTNTAQANGANKLSLSFNSTSNRYQFQNTYGNDTFYTRNDVVFTASN